MTTFAPNTHKLTFLKVAEGTITDPNTWLAGTEAIWAVDAVLSSLNSAGLLNIVISDTQPGNTESVWVDPNNPASAAASVTKLWEQATGTWKVATLPLFVDMIRRVGGFATTAAAGSVVGNVQNSLTGDGAAATPLGVNVDNSGNLIKMSVSATGLKVEVDREMPLQPTPTAGHGILVSGTDGTVADTKEIVNAEWVKPTRLASQLMNELFPGTVTHAAAAPAVTTKPWFDTSNAMLRWNFWDDKNAAWVVKTLVDASTLLAYANKVAGAWTLISSTSTPSVAEQVNIWLDLNLMQLKFWDGAAWVPLTPAGLSLVNGPKQATETVVGIAQVATQAEVDAGGIDTDMVSPLKLASLGVNSVAAQGVADSIGLGAGRKVYSVAHASDTAAPSLAEVPNPIDGDTAIVHNVANDQIAMHTRQGGAWVGEAVPAVATGAYVFATGNPSGSVAVTPGAKRLYYSAQSTTDGITITVSWPGGSFTQSSGSSGSPVAISNQVRNINVTAAGTMTFTTSGAGNAGGFIGVVG